MYTCWNKHKHQFLLLLCLVCSFLRCVATGYEFILVATILTSTKVPAILANTFPTTLMVTQLHPVLLARHPRVFENNIFPLFCKKKVAQVTRYYLKPFFCFLVATTDIKDVIIIMLEYTAQSLLYQSCFIDGTGYDIHLEFRI